MKRIATGVLTGVIALTLVGCGSGVNNSTALDAAKTFTQAEIDGDSKVLKEIDHSNALIYPPQTVLDNASRLGYSKHKLDEFKFEQVDDITVNVTGPKDIPSKSLIFTKEDGKYYFINFDSIKKLQSTQEQVQSTQSAQPTQSTQSTQPPQPTQQTQTPVVTDKKDIYIGEWKGSNTEGESSNSNGSEFTFVFSKDGSGTVFERGIVKGVTQSEIWKQAEFKYSIDLKKNPAWLDINYFAGIKQGKKQAIDESEYCIVRFNGNDKMEIQFPDMGNRPEQFNPVDKNGQIRKDRNLILTKVK